MVVVAVVRVAVQEVAVMVGGEVGLEEEGVKAGKESQWCCGNGGGRQKPIY
jgi:hypothetical protein